MKRSAALLIVFLLIINGFVMAQTSVTKLTDRSKKGLLSYFKILVANNKVIVGQQCSQSPDVDLEYQKNFKRLYDSTGKYPGLLGLEYGWFANAPIDKVNQYAIQHWRAGGLVTISWHADCPFTDGFNVRWDAIANKNTIDFKKLLQDAPNSKEKTAYHDELNRIAKALKLLKDAGVVVLWRPFHEMNGSWFWWGTNDNKTPTNVGGFVALWKDMYQTLTKDYGLDNLIWVYAPNAAGTSLPSAGVFYPGDKYVDMVATDSYPRQPNFDDYPELLKLNKPITNGEIGPHRDAYGKFDQIEVLNTFKGKAPYFLQWHSWPGASVNIIDNLRYKQMMNDADAVTLDKLR